LPEVLLTSNVSSQSKTKKDVCNNQQHSELIQISQHYGITDRNK